MRRSLLLSVVTLGTVLAMVVVTGVVASFTDEAKTGTNSFETAALPSAVDLQLATYVLGAPSACGAFTEDLVTAPYSVAGLTPSPDVVFAGDLYCLRNIGTMTARVSVRAFEVLDEEIGCTGDEAEAGDTTCGAAAVGEPPVVGELSPLVEMQIMKFGTDCTGGGSGSAFAWESVADLAVTPAAFLDLAPDKCINFQGLYRYNPSGIDALQAQSDKLTFRLALNAIEAPVA